jgi:hypothetical protein
MSTPGFRGPGAGKTPPGHAAWSASEGLKVLVIFAIVQFASNLVLLSETINNIRILRIFSRAAPFSLSLYFLYQYSARRERHPAHTLAVWALGIVFLNLVHPTGNWPLAALAQAALNMAIVAPIFWATRTGINLTAFRWVVMVTWVFHLSSTGMGLLQVAYPGRFEPAVSSMAVANATMVRGLQIILEDGSVLYRPMGLTDTPGGAASSAFYAIVFGVGFLLSRDSSFLVRMLAASSIPAGFACLFFCQVRSVMVLTVVCLVVMSVVMAIREQYTRALTLVAGSIGSLLLGLTLVATLGGGQRVTQRVSSLLEGDISNTYYTNRGVFLEQTITDLVPRYPLGAGLGRWGMMYAYFGDWEDLESTSLWVEIQWTAWLFDGGLPLVFVYAAGLIHATIAALRIAFARGAAGESDLWLWGMVIVGYNVGAFALTFNYPLFIGGLGMEFWMFNGALFAAAATEAARDSRDRKDWRRA